MTNRKLLSLLLSVSMMVSMVSVPVSAAAPAAEEHDHDHDTAVVASSPEYTGEFSFDASQYSFNEEEDGGYFYKQLASLTDEEHPGKGEMAQKAYQAMMKMAKGGGFESGTLDYDLVANGDYTVENAQAYVDGDRDPFEAWAAAKDAFDLDHSEYWYLDSSYLSFRAAKAEDGYHIIMGIGRTTNYMLAGDGTLAETVEEKDAEVQKAIQTIVDKAKADLADAQSKGYSEADQKAALVRSVHNSITNTISYRFEDECKEGNEKYIRTLYALVTHEGVCESYARAMQVALTQLDVDCILVHGVQASGTPEDHMWNAVSIDDSETGEERWYVVDATWDDPLTADWYGRRELVDVEKSNGVDGKENTTYLLVGQNVVGQDWLPSGNVSVGGSSFEFSYPTISDSSFDGSTMFQDENGLKVNYTAGAGSMEDIPAGCFTVTFQGMNAEEAKAKGFYFLIKMYKTNRDGTTSQFQDWYYVDAALALLEGNPYFGDTKDGLRIYTGNCDYVQIAVTTCKPVGLETWKESPLSGKNQLLQNMDLGYFHGNPGDIIGQTDMLYNTESDYQAPPYVLKQTPPQNIRYTAGSGKTMTITWDDTLYHPADKDDRGPIAKASEQINAIASELMAIDNSAGETSSSQDDREKVLGETVRVRYATFQPDSYMEGIEDHELVGEVDFDTNHDGYVDDEALTIFYQEDLCPLKKSDPQHKCSWEQGCPINGVEFHFTPSTQWADDLTLYQFYFEGVVGSKSWRTPNLAEVTVVCPSLCPYCYRSQGIDWNLWGRPRMLDNPDDLDLSQIAMEGVDGSEESLQDLQDRMKVDRMNGRLTLVAENIGEGGNDRQKYEQVTEALEEQKGLGAGDILSKLMYEIQFTKLCAKTIASTGDSMRIQIGYPAGFDYEQYLNNEVTFKAYHFTRDDDGKIISVEEIPIIFTSYGMVIMVSSFSPFEIVALDPESVPAAVATDTKTVLAAFGEGGALLRDDRQTKTVGSDGVIELKPGESVTFYVQPDEGYELEAVTFDGHELPVNIIDNSVTIEYGDFENTCLINASFVAEQAVIAEEAAGLAPVVADTANEFSASVPARFEKVLYVGAQGADAGMDYETIQAAIDAIADGSAIEEKNIQVDNGSEKTGWTIEVNAGEFDRFLVPSDLSGLTIQGKKGLDTGAYETIINVMAGKALEDKYSGTVAEGSDGQGVIVLGGNVILRDLQFKAGSAQVDSWKASAIQVSDGKSTMERANGLEVENCSFVGQGTGIGIMLDNKVDTYTISGCSFDNWAYGIHNENSSSGPQDVIITDNTFSECGTSAGIVYMAQPEEAGSGLTFTGNSFTGKADGTATKVNIADMSEDGESSVSVTVSDNEFGGPKSEAGGVVLSVTGVSADELQSDLTEDNTVGAGSEIAAIIPDADGTCSLELNASGYTFGSWQILSEDAPEDVQFTDPEGQEREFLDYLKAVIDAANSENERTLVISGVAADSASTVLDWLKQNVSFVAKQGPFIKPNPDVDPGYGLDACEKDGHVNDGSGFCPRCGKQVPEHMVANKTIYVSKEDKEYTEIQTAINFINAQEDKTGYTIEVADGEYDRFLVMYGVDNLTIKAKDDGNDVKPLVKTMEDTDPFIGIDDAYAAGYLYRGALADGRGSIIGSKGVTIQDLAFESGTVMGAWGGNISSAALQVGDGFSSADHVNDGLVVDGCDFTGSNAGKGISIFNSTETFTVQDCTFENYPDAIWHMNSYSAPVDIEIVNNTFDNCAHALWVNFGGNIKQEELDQHTEGKAVFTGNVLNGGPSNRMAVTVLDMSDHDELTDLDMSGNTFKYVDIIQHGLDAHEGIENILDENTSDAYSLYIGVEDKDAETGSYDVILHASKKQTGAFELSPRASYHADTPNITSWAEKDTYHTLVAYVTALIDQAYKDYSYELNIQDLVAVDITDITSWVHDNISFQYKDPNADPCRGGHKWDAATGTCSVCHEKHDHTGHEGTVQDYKDASCLEDGHTAGVQCTVCGYVITEPTTIPAHGHVWDGETCTKCGAQAEHQPGQPVITDPTCTSVGYKRTYCEVCHTMLSEEEIPMVDHQWNSATGECIVCNEDCEHDSTTTEFGEDKEPTCTEPGSKKGEKCDICGMIVVPETTIPATGHEETEPLGERQEPTCTEPGLSEGKKCVKCGETVEEQKEIPPKGHTYEDGNCIDCQEPDPHCDHPADRVRDYQDAVEASCTEPGSTAGKWCDKCGTMIEAPQPTDPKGHSFVDGVCEDCDYECPHGAWTDGKCDICGKDCEHTYSALDGICTICGEACKHEHVVEHVVDATCVDAGYKHDKCQVCGMSLEEAEVIPALGHTYENGKCIRCDIDCPHEHFSVTGEDKEATCTEAGSTSGRVCDDCGAVLLAEGHIAPTGHQNLVAAGEEKAPTCQDTGLTAGQKCADCGTVITPQEEIPTVGHHFVNGKCAFGCGEVDPNCPHQNVVTSVQPKAPTCTEPGCTEGKVCADCGASIVDSIILDPTGHLEDQRNAKDPTCTEAGATPETYCTICGDVLIESVPIEPLNHNLVADEAVEPTCTEPGKTAGTHCSICGEVFQEQKFVDSLGHQFDENGQCVRCDATNPEHKHCYDDQHAGNLVSDENAVEPTCTEPGKTASEHCDVCGKTVKEQEEIPALGHDYGPDGKCVRCGEVDPEYVPKCENGHHIGPVVSDNNGVPATCTEPGKTASTHCEACGETVDEQTEIPALGHEYGDDGKCVRCGDVKPGSSSGSGSSSHHSSGSSSSTYRVNVLTAKHGKVTSSRNYASYNSTVTLTVKPDKGYELDELIVTRKSDNKEVELTEKDDNKFTFKMPRGQVDVEVTFKEISETTSPEPSNPNPGTSELPSLPFTDIVAGSWYYSQVQYLYGKRIISGTSATTFSPSMITTRSQLVQMLYSLEGSPNVDAVQESFADVNPGDWFYAAVKWAYSNGIVAGYSEHTFGANDPITREQMVTILHRYALDKGMKVNVGDAQSLLKFKDQSFLSSWAKDGMTWAVNNGLVSGFEDGSLQPWASATRSQVAVIMCGFVKNFVEPMTTV